MLSAVSRVAAFFSTDRFRAFGGSPGEATLPRMRASSRFSVDHFENAEPTTLMKAGTWETSKHWLLGEQARSPASPVPIVVDRRREPSPLLQRRHRAHERVLRGRFARRAPSRNMSRNVACSTSSGFSVLDDEELAEPRGPRCHREVHNAHSATRDLCDETILAKCLHELLRLDEAPRSAWAAREPRAARQPPAAPVHGARLTVRKGRRPFFGK